MSDTNHPEHSQEKGRSLKFLSRRRRIILSVYDFLETLPSKIWERSVKPVLEVLVIKSANIFLYSSMELFMMLCYH